MRTRASRATMQSMCAGRGAPCGMRCTVQAYALWVVLLLVSPTPSAAQDSSCTDRLNTGIKMGDKAASCPQLKPYCTRTSHAAMVKEVCPASCGVCSPASAPKPPPGTASPTDVAPPPTPLPVLSTPLRVQETAVPPDACAKDAACFGGKYACEGCCSRGEATDGTTCWTGQYSHKRCCMDRHVPSF